MGIKFEEKELEVKEIFKAFRDAQVPVFHFPVSMKEGWKRMALEKKPIWLCTGVEVFNFYPDIIPDNRARGFVNDGGIQISNEEKGGKDMFGIEWVFVPTVGGSMEKPGIAHLFEDANDWEESIVWPDVDAWDWEGCSQRNKEYLKNEKFNYVPLLNGFGFERLISFMGFEDAAVDLVDEEQDSEETIRTKAREFVRRVCSDPNKICIINRYFSPQLQGVYAEELYKESRLIYQDR